VPSVEPTFAFDTLKNRVLVYEDRVCKTYKAARDSALHARREMKALRRLAGLDGVPVVLGFEPNRMTLVMSRIPGKRLSECESVAEHSVKSLRRLVEQMLERGVARHSLPPRDVLVAPDGSAGLVDFERSTRRLFPGDPVWIVAKAISRYHLIRRINEHAPHLLTPSEQRRLRWQVALLARWGPRAKSLRRAVRAFFRRS
jgi:hypothetical protein